MTRALAVAAILALATLPSVSQTDCGHSGNAIEVVNPEGISTPAILDKAAASESLFKAARNRYTYVEDIKIQTLRPVGLPGNLAVDGEYRQVLDVSYDSSGRRLEQVTFAPQSTLSRINVTNDDFDNIHTYAAYPLTSGELPKYSFSYAGKQHLDELDAYVFDITPKVIEQKKKYFQGRIWVEENVHATYVTYREWVDGNWFPSYTRSDDILQFTNTEIRIRQIVRYSGYKLSSANPQREQHQSLAPDQ